MPRLRTTYVKENRLGCYKIFKVFNALLPAFKTIRNRYEWLSERYHKVVSLFIYLFFLSFSQSLISSFAFWFDDSITRFIHRFSIFVNCDLILSAFDKQCRFIYSVIYLSKLFVYREIVTLPICILKVLSFIRREATAAHFVFYLPSTRTRFCSFYF